MKKLKILKIAIMAAGFFISAAFYVRSPEGSSLVSMDEKEREPAEDEKTGSEGEDKVIDLYELNRLSSAQREEVEKLIDDAIYELRAEISGAAENAVRDTAAEGSEAETASEGSSDEGTESRETSETQVAGGKKININTAGKEELMELKGIGEARAEAIILYRETYGGFGYIEEIMNVSGIKEAAFSKIKDQICV